MQLSETKSESSDREHIELATEDVLKSNLERIQSKLTVLISEDKTLPLSLGTSDDHEMLRSNLTSKLPDMAKETNTLKPKKRKKNASLPPPTLPKSPKPTPPPKVYNPQKVGISLLPVAIETEDDEEQLKSLGAKLLKRRQIIESAHEHLPPDLISTENVIPKAPQPASQTTDDITKQDSAKMNLIRTSNTLDRQPSVADKPVDILNLDQKDDHLEAILERQKKQAESLN